MKIKLSDHFTYGRLLRFTLPSVVMMVIASIYSVVDGLFVSNLVGDMALSAVNIIFPVSMIIGAFGFMLGTGGRDRGAHIRGGPPGAGSAVLLHDYLRRDPAGGRADCGERLAHRAYCPAGGGQRCADPGLCGLWTDPSAGKRSVHAPGLLSKLFVVAGGPSWGWRTLLRRV